ncbi:MAG: capsule assembly Wzi family protein [Pseudomonadota bacterium]
MGTAAAEPLAAPGDLRLRHDLQLLNDSGVINMPLTAWPVSLGDVHGALDGAQVADLRPGVEEALERVRNRLAWELAPNSVDLVFGAAISSDARVIRTFENTPRADAEAYGRLTWIGNTFTFNLSATYANDPIDGDELRPDGSYVGVALGNWIVTAGWQDRWHGPGRDGSLILGSNARPAPGVMLQRNRSQPFKSKWLSWIGPWTLSTFMSQLDDDRDVNDALLFGIRGSFRPLKGLEIGLSRTAQWCGDDRPCDLSTFGDLLLGRDNSGVNVDPQDEPGNQLGGFDIRYSLPRNIPAALYMQWIGEDGRPGDGLIGSWMRQVGIEHWGSIGGLSHRTHFEVSDTLTREGGFGFSDEKPDTAYEHFIYTTGYRYKQRVLGHPADGDSLSYSLGSTLVQSAGHTWNVTLRYMEINRAGSPNERHTLSPTPQERIDAQLSHERETSYGRFYVGLGYSSLDDEATDASDSEFTAFFRWTSR